MNETAETCPVLYDWIEVTDLLNMLHLTKNTLKEWCAEGPIPCSRIKNKTYFLRQDIEQFLYSHYKSPQS